jgi:hypothetical protein
VFRKPFPEKAVGIGLPSESGSAWVFPADVTHRAGSVFCLANRKIERLRPPKCILTRYHKCGRGAKTGRILSHCCLNVVDCDRKRSLALELYDQIISLCQRARFTPRIVQEAMQLPTIVSLVAAGIGVAVIPASLQNLGRTGVSYSAIRETTPKAELAVAWRPERPSPLLQPFLDVVTEWTKDEGMGLPLPSSLSRVHKKC